MGPFFVVVRGLFEECLDMTLKRFFALLKLNNIGSYVVQRSHTLQRKRNCQRDASNADVKFGQS